MTAAPPSELDRALEALWSGGMVVVSDDSGSGLGELVGAAEFVTAGMINFMAREARGLICVALTGEQCDRLSFPLMTAASPRLRAAFTISIEARQGISTGISAADRAQTIAETVRGDAVADDFVRPGHIFPIRVRDGGVVARPGLSEAAVDLMKAAGLRPAGVTCHILNSDGAVADHHELRAFCSRHDLPLVPLSAVVRNQLRQREGLERVSESEISTEFGSFRAIRYSTRQREGEHVALVLRDVGSDGVIVGVHNACLASSLFEESQCSCRERLDASFARVADEGAGVIVYVTSSESCGLFELSPASLAEADAGSPSQDPESPVAAIVADVLGDLGISSIRLIPDTSDLSDAIRRHGVEVLETTVV